MAEQQRSGTQKAARGAQIVGGIIKIATGIASQNYAQAIIGAIEVIPWKKVFTVVGVILLIVLMPIIIIASIPQLLFNWATSSFEDLITRNKHSTEIVDYYYEVLEEQDEDVDPDIEYLICIQSVLCMQDVESVSKQDVEDMIEISYTVDAKSGEIYNRSADEIMDELGFDDEQKNWANLMYTTINWQDEESLS